MPGRVRPQVGGAQTGPVLIEYPERGAGGDGRPTLVSRHPAPLRLGVPGLRPLQGGPAAPVLGRRRELRLSPAGPAPRQGQLAGKQPGLQRQPGPARRGQVVRGPLHRPDAGTGPGPGGRRDLRAQHGEPGQRGPAPAALLAELAHRGAGLFEPQLGLPVQDGRLSQQQPGLRQVDLAAPPLEFLDRHRRRLHRLGQQPHRQQQLGPVGEQFPDRYAVLAQPLLGQVEVVQRGRHVTAQPADPALVLVHEPERQVKVVLEAQLLGLAQVVLGRGELLPVAVDDGPVGQQPLDPHVVPGPALGGQGGTVVGQRLIEPAEHGQDCAPLGLSPRPRQPGQVGQRDLHLTQGLAALTADVQGEGQPGPGVRDQLGRARPLAEPHRLA